ncbi:MAG: glycosyltransferase family 2 protein [Bdellovibrionota bacterium]
MSASTGQNLSPGFESPSRLLVVVVPAYNEKTNIAGVLAELSAVRLERTTVEVVVVDDGSTDGTAELARRLGTEVVCLPFNMGIGMSVQTGVLYALKRGADFVVQVDGDGQHVPGEISKLLAVLETTRSDVVVGSRFARKRRGGLESTTLARWLAGRALAMVVRLLTGQRFSDTTSGFRIYTRRAAQLVAHSYSDDYPEVEALVALVRRGFQVTEIGVQMRRRIHGKSSIGAWKSIYYFIKVILSSCIEKVRA